jgi:hypothetical protein
MRRPGYLNDYDGDFGQLKSPLENQPKKPLKKPLTKPLTNSLENLDKMIDTYQQHIAALNKILAVGSPGGKVQAAKKLAEEQKSLKVLLDKRENLVQD